MGCEAAFMAELAQVARRGEWVTCSDVAQRLYPRADRDELLQRSREVSRELSNLERRDRIERRRRAGDERYFEYRIPPLRRERVTRSMLPGWCSMLAA